MANEYGLDYKYFEGKLKLIARDCSRYTPAEMQRELTRLAEVAQSQRKQAVISHDFNQ